MVNERDPWSAARSATREEVRAIFEREAEAEAATAPGRKERFDPLPALVALPRRLWRMLGPRGRLIVGLTAAVLAVVAVAGFPSFQRTKSEGAAEARRAEQASLRARLRALRLDQRPHTSRMSGGDVRAARRAGGLTRPAALTAASGALEGAISGDVRARIAAGSLEGPVRRTDCRALRVSSETQASFNCFVRLSTHRVLGRRLESGYRFRGRADLRARRYVWCKENPRPLHPDTSHFPAVPLDPRCG
jgi:hypothetical protein